MKKYLVLVLFLFTLCSKQEGYSCVNCASVAFRIQLVDSQDSSLISNATIVAVNQSKHDTVFADSSYLFQQEPLDSVGRYAIAGLPGRYSLKIYKAHYDTLYISGLWVTQWSDVTCEHANTENLVIRLNKTSLTKGLNKKSGEIVKQFTKGHC